MMIRPVLAAVVMAATSWSAPAEACGAVASGLFEIAMPFENQQVARNAVLRTPSLLGVTDGLGPTTLHGPNNATMEGTWVADGSGARLDLNESDGLSPGAWRVELRFGDEVIREVPFEVIDEIDETPPTTDLLIVLRKAPLLQGENNCGRTPNRLDLQFNSSDSENDRPAVVVVEHDGVERHRLMARERIIDQFVDDARPLSVHLIDMAGNVGATLEITNDDIAVDPAGLGSCASAPLSTSSLFAAVLLFVRRRRLERANAR